ncbi:MAG: hypothetical protein KIH08_15675 [Candidatus Freyarchaeota archaeon]|nr:hypothetical protein [Candidatus Jordarchaeia archaeon]MBS7270584.1 hypothetical protein [Candidatus Jordarchaeia archaeon]MBS7281474.1 hypothetical protein [Candidatus Jordarchaeia archaeon]
MVEPKISDFKMFERAPYKIPDPKALMDAQMIGFMELEKFYGPVFKKLLIKHALQFISQKIGEEPPKNIESLDQLAEYLLSKTDKYPLPNCAGYYAQIKTEKELQGLLGAAYRLSEASFHKSHIKRQTVEGLKFNLDEIMANLYQFAIESKLAPEEFGYRVNRNGSLDALFPNCFYKEVCRQAFEEGLLKRAGGSMHCAMGVTLCQYFKMVTGYEWDYELVEYDRPHCIIKCYII